MKHAPAWIAACTTRGITFPNAHEVMSTFLPVNCDCLSPEMILETRRLYWNSNIAEITG